MANVNNPRDLTQVLIENEGSFKVPRLFDQVLGGATSSLDLSRAVSQIVQGATSHVRAARVITQVLIPALPEPPVSEHPFPGFGNSLLNPTVPAAADPFYTDLPGLTYSVHKRPMFNTQIAKAANAREVRSAMQEMPVWEFEFQYDYIKDTVASDSSLKKVMGFFLARQGSFDSFLIKDPDDYLVTNGPIGVGTGAQPDYYFRRYMSDFGEIVGQVDETNTIEVFVTEAEAHTIPATGPYMVTVNQNWVENIVVKTADGVTTFVRVVGAPGTGQYSVIDGAYLFNAAQANAAIKITYRYLVDPSDYDVNAPNRLLFHDAPNVGSTVTASFQFFFAVRFTDDKQDYEKFMDRLWTLQSCKMTSVIQ